MSSSFQSTPSQRGRHAREIMPHIAINISIHALAKRATHLHIPFSSSRQHFNPRPRKEGDPTNSRLFHTEHRFQSTPSQRGRLHFCLTDDKYILFQSTPSQRGRPGMPDTIDVRYLISIHALAKRATISHFSTVYSYSFQSTPSQRGRPYRLVSRASICSHFNPRPRKEGDSAF